MNLNEYLVNKKKPKGIKHATKNSNSNAVYGVNKVPMGPPPTPPLRKKSTPSSDLNWGRSHISVPNTVSSSARKSRSSSKVSSEEPESKIIVALTEGRGGARCEVGIAAVDVAKPLIVLCQISDTQSYINTLTKINIINPNEILVPTTFVDHFTENRLVTMIRKQFPKIKITGIPRSTFSKISGLETLSSLCVPSLNGILLVLQHRYYAVAAASALVTHIQENLFIYYAKGTIKIEYQESEGYAIIDTSTADRLELVCSTKPAQANKYSSLFGVLNHCCTNIGMRTLRSSILRPPCKVEYIEERLECVAELLNNPEARVSIQALLQSVSNIDILLGIATILPTDPQKCSNRQLNYVLLLNGLLDLVAPLKDVLSKFKMPFFVQLRKTLDDEAITHIKNSIRKMLNEDAHPAKGSQATMQRCFAIKCGVNGLLDLVRKTYSERLNDLQEYTKQLSEKYGLAFTLHNNQTKGYHLVLPLKGAQKRTLKKSDLPEEFIEVQRLAGSFTMKTPELMNFSTRLEDIMTDILKISNVLVHTLIVEVKQYVYLFYTLCEQIAYLDMLQSLAETSAIHGYVRPTFGNLTELTFARHPLLDFLLPTRPVSNPIICSDDFNVHVITGPNGSGKSIFIRQVMLLQVMAQVGCYVPAQSAMFKPADFMFARIYLDDNMEYGASSFVLEMKEMKYVMSTITGNSLVIIDELCRSTSVEEGTALAIAIVEKLLQSSAFIYITTHFVLLTKLYDMYPNVKIWQMETVPIGDDPRSFKLHYKYSLLPGVTSVRQYGVYIVRNIWPDYVIKWVDEILEKIAEKPKEIRMSTLDPKCRLKYTIESEFRRLKHKRQLTVSAINKLLIKYQNELSKLGYNINIQPFPERNLQQTHSLQLDEDYPMEMYVGENNVQQDLGNQEIALRTMFTPEPSMQSQETNLSQAKWEEVFTPEPSPYDGFPQDSQYGQISRFIAEDPQNIYKLMPEISIYENQENLFPDTPVPPERTMADDSCLRTLVGSTSTPIVQRFDGMRNFPSSSDHEETPVSDQSRICPNYDFYYKQRQDLTVDEIESIKEDLEICNQILNDGDDFGEIEQSFEPNVYKHVDANTFQDSDKHQTLPKSTVQVDEILTDTHKQYNNVPELDVDGYNNFAAHISGSYKELTDVPLSIDEFQNNVEEQVEEIEEEKNFAEPIKRGRKTQRIENPKTNESTNDIILQPFNTKFTLPTKTPFQMDQLDSWSETHSFDFGKSMHENIESWKAKDIESEGSMKLLRSSKQEKLESGSNLPRKEILDGPQTTITHTTEKETDHIELQEKSAGINKKSEFAKPNTYKYYRSPLMVNIIEGPNDKTLSIDEDDLGEEEVNVQPRKIDVLEHIVFTPSGTIISAVNKAQEQKINQDVNAQNIEEDIVHENFNIDNPEVDIKAKQEIDRVGCDEGFKTAHKNNQKSNETVQSQEENRQEPNQSYNEIETDKGYLFKAMNKDTEIRSDQSESFKSAACSENEKKGMTAMGKTIVKLIDQLDQSVASFKSVAEAASEYESPYDESTFKLHIPANPSEKTITRFFSCDDADIGKQMNRVTNGIPIGKNSAKVNVDTERNDRGDEENVTTNEGDASNVSDIQKQSTTGITDASKLRNLDSSTDTSEDYKTITEDTRSQTSTIADGESNDAKKPSSPTTSISSASKKRNLDQVTTSTSIEQEATSDSTTPHKTSSENKESDADKYAASESSCNVGVATKRKKMTKRKFVSPRDPRNQSKTETSSDSKPKQNILRKFRPPRKLTAKEIREEFERQDQKLIELTHTTTNSSDMSKYLERLMNRPTVKEVQNTTHLALIRKTDQGPEVIPAEAKKYKKRRNSSIRRIFSNENIDLSIFSDKNAEYFEKYLDSNETNYTSFKFNFQESKKTETVFKFDPIEMKSGEYTDRSITMSFMRKASDESMEQSQSSRPMFTPLKPPFSPQNQTLTPDGYFKQHKTEITNLLSKYRQQGSLQDAAIGGQPRNIFESSNSIHCDDLNL